MDSPELLLLIGELKGTMISVQATVLDLHKEIKGVSIDLTNLPCREHTQDIKSIKEWRDTCKMVNSDNNKSKWTFKTELAKSGFIILGAVITLLLTWIFK
jgi:hypothetical protein